MSDFWNERYSEKEYVYGEAPNIFFAEEISKSTPGLLILPCEGEGRNAVYAASIGWQVKAFDTSEAGKNKAMQLAVKKAVAIDYIVADALTVHYPENCADAVAFIYAHFPTSVRKQIHQKAIGWLKPGGKIIMEVFNPKQLQNNTGGPKDLEMLCTEDMIRDDFPGFKIEYLQTMQTILHEGSYHEGLSDILRFVGTK